MAVDRKFKFKIGDVEHEAVVPEGWLAKAEVAEDFMPKDKFQEELKRRVDSATKELKKPEDLLNDEEFLTKAATEKKDFFVKLLEVKAGDIDVAKLQTEAMDRVRTDEVKPLQEAAKKTVETIQVLRRRDLDGQIATAALTLGVDPELNDLVKIFVRDHSNYSPDHDSWLIKRLDGSDGFELSTDPDKQGSHPYMSAAEFLEVTKKGGKKKIWFKATTQEGVDYQGAEHGDGRVATLDQFTKLSPADQTKFYGTNPEQHGKFMDQIRTKGEQSLMDSGSPFAVAGAKDK